MGRVVDMTGVGDYKPVPASVYTLEFTGGEWTKVQKGPNIGTEMYKAKFTIQDETTEDGEKVSGKVIFRNWNLLPQSLWVFKNDAVALGYDPALLEGKIDLDAVIPQLVGRRAIGTVTVQEYAYPEGHAKHGQTRYSNDIAKLEQADIPEMLAPASRRR